MPSSNIVPLGLITVRTSDPCRLVRLGRASNRKCRTSGMVARRSLPEVRQDPEKEELHLELCQVIRFSPSSLLVGASKAPAVSCADERIALLHQICHAQGQLLFALCKCWHDGATNSPARVHKPQAPPVSLLRRHNISIVQSST